MTQYQNNRHSSPPATQPGYRLAAQQHGFTMVELLVALVLSLLIALAAIAALTATRQGFNTVDAASQLRDNGRFTADLVQRLAVQTGFKDVWYAAQPATPAEVAANVPPNISGFNNALSSASDPLNTATARTSGVEGYGSDVLILRNQLVRLNDSSNNADGSMIDCMGNTLTTGAAPASRGDRMASILSVAVSTGEPSLMCSTVQSDGTITAGQPIIRGIENFQVLYGVDGFTTVNTAFDGPQDSVPDRYLRADQMVVGGATDSAATHGNWRRVRSLRIGMILRGPANSAQSAVTQTLYPFGSSKASASAVAGSGLSASTDVGTIFSAPADGRLRQILTFTVHLRNDQGL